MVPGIGSQKKLCLISIIRQTNAMESKTAWIRLFYIVFVVVSFTIATASALKCYKCKGPDDGRPYPKSICEDEQTEVTCSSENYTCGKYHHEIKSGALINEVEARSCVADCRYIELSCRAIILAGGECTFSCCDEDLCNTVTRLTSHLFLTAGAFVSAAVYLYKF